MITAKHMLAAFKSLEITGIRPPEAIGADMAAAARAYAARLTEMTEADLVAAIDSYLDSPMPKGKWFREWPDVGTILAHAPARRQVAADADDSAATFRTLLGAVSSWKGGEWVPDTRPGMRGEVWERKPPPRLMRRLETEADLRRERALWAGVAALGGWWAIGELNPEFNHQHERTFAEAYTRVMREPLSAPLAIPARPAAAALPSRDLAQLTGGIGVGGRR